MKKVLASALFLLFVLQVPAMAQDIKIGVLDMEKYSRESLAGQEVAAQMKTTLEPKVKEIQRVDEEFNRLKEDYIKQSSAYSLEVQNAKKLELKRKGRDIEDMKLEFQRFAKAEEERLTKPVQELMQKVAEEFAKENGYDLLLEMRVSGVLFINEEKLDITDELVKALDEAWNAR
jgi:outer membrane protein